MKKYLVLAIVALLSQVSFSQDKKETTTQKGPSYITSAYSNELVEDISEIIKAVPKGVNTSLNHEKFPQWQLTHSLSKKGLQPLYNKSTGKVIAIKGSVPELKKYNTHNERCLAYMDIVKDIYHINDPQSEIRAHSTSTDSKNRIHTKLDQYFNGIKVHGGELSIHEAEGNIYMLQGGTHEIDESLSTSPTLSQEDIHLLVKSNPNNNFKPIPESVKPLFHHDQISSELTIYNHNGEMKLVYMLDVFLNLVDRETQFIDAQNGEVLHKFKTICKFHNHTEVEEFDGKATTVAKDLFGTNRNINIYDCSGEFFLVDAARPMFNGQATTCDMRDRILYGVIITQDAGNTSPSNRNFNFDISSSRNPNNWQDPIAISAHYNGGRAYEYFRNVHGRESITGKRTNIVSFINVSEDDGSSMDNAYWNGEFIFYGNGNEAFTSPLAKALDVAGHEMTHGVVTSTANLVYENEPGALNEHFADVFGVLIEDEDFRIGEDVANPNIFSTGAIRSMQDPNNGGTSLRNPGYQPAHVDDQVEKMEGVSEVHINSGIPNHAFYKFVVDESFGSDINDRAAIAGKIWYKALTQYLRSTSNFADMRVAILQAATEEYGQTVADAAAKAFDDVGITSSAVVTPEAEDLDSNPGDEFVIWSDINFQNIKIAKGTGEDFGFVSETAHISRPSVTDDGRLIIFVNSDKHIQLVEIDWTGPTIVRDQVISQSPIYRNAAISKDGSKLAALTGDLNEGNFENMITVFDLVGNTSRDYQLYNPTFSENTTSTGGVLYADVLEFDHTGENIIYDAFNQLSGTLGQDIDYWDIGIINVWDNESNQFTLGNIFKLFSGLPQNVSIGNPTFSKNSPNIIAFDFFETDPDTDERNYSILGLNRETGDVGTIYESNTLGYPSFSIGDNQLIFNFDNSGTQILAIADLNENKISSDNDAFVFLENAEWGVYMGTGNRNLSTATEEEIRINQHLSVYPNPSTNVLHVALDQDNFDTAVVSIYSLQGQKLKVKEVQQNDRIDISELVSGIYIMQYHIDGSNIFRKVIKN